MGCGLSCKGKRSRTRRRGQIRPRESTGERHRRLSDVDRVREEARKRVVYGLLGLYGAVVAALLAADFTGCISLAEAKDLALIVLSPTVVMIGAALGFYFGSHDDRG